MVTGLIAQVLGSRVGSARQSGAGAVDALVSGRKGAVGGTSELRG